MSVFENEISRFVWFADRSNNPEQRVSFIKLYSKLQSEIILLIADKLGISQEELQSRYDTFYAKYPIDASCLDVTAEKKEFFNHIIRTRDSDRFMSVHESLSKRYAGLL